MSGEQFSNADTGDKHPDPYKKTYQNDLPVKQKVEDLINFIDGCKFGMMTTRQAQTGLLVSRCMALAKRVIKKEKYTFPSFSGHSSQPFF